jgi:hypothetical protein
VTEYNLFTIAGPSTGTAYATGDLVYGVTFQVGQGGLWFYGYRLWVLPTTQILTGYKFALWQVTGVDAATPSPVPGSVVTAGTLTAGQWNEVLLPAPILLEPGYTTDSIGTTYGACYHACVGNPGNDWGAFPETKNQFGATQPYAGGITDGPLTGYSSLSGSLPAGGTSQWLPQMAYNNTFSDPSTAMPTLNDSDANLWMDVVVRTTAPASPAYRMAPAPTFNVPGAGGQEQGYTLGTAFTLTQACTLDAIWHFSPSGSTALPTRCGIWNATTQTEVSGTDNSAPSWSGAAGSGWVSCSYTGVTLPAGNYVVSTFLAAETSPWFLAQTLWWSTAFPSGITAGPAEFTGTQYNLGPTWTFPATTAPEWDGVDVQLTPVSAPAQGATLMPNQPPTDVTGVNRIVPAAAYGAGAGTSPPGTPTVTGDDARGTVTFGSGTTTGAGTVVTITFIQPRDANRPPVIMISEESSASAGVDFAAVPVISGSQCTGFNLVTNTRNLAASQANGTYGVSWLLGE